MPNILLVAATVFEIAPLMTFLEKEWRSLGPASFENEATQVDVLIGGIGMVATTLSLSKALQQNQYDFVLQLGIGGAYPTKKVELADVVWVQNDRIADLGAMDAVGQLLSVSDMGLIEKSATILPAPALLYAFLPLFNPITPAQGLTVNCIQGDPKWGDFFVQDAEAVVVESMEGAALHFVCSDFNIPFAQVRSISNWVEPRDKSRWKMQEAIHNLNEWAIELVKMLASTEPQH